MTYYSLYKWYKKEFEKLGWVVTSTDEEKKSQYKKRLYKLYKHLENAYTIYTDQDKLHDIKVMLKKTKTLIKYIS
ncbi:hypothetical protein EB118_18860 [bacterium]|nr:hypothetical protein [bacterium]